MPNLMRVRVAGDVRPIIQNGKLMAIFLSGVQVPGGCIREYRENAIYFDWPPNSFAEANDEHLVLTCASGWLRHRIRLPIQNVTEYGQVEIPKR